MSYTDGSEGCGTKRATNLEIICDPEAGRGFPGSSTLVTHLQLVQILWKILSVFIPSNGVQSMAVLSVVRMIILFISRNAWVVDK